MKDFFDQKKKIFVSLLLFSIRNSHSLTHTDTLPFTFSVSPNKDSAITFQPPTLRHMYAAEVIGMFAVRGVDASLAVPATTNKCCKNAAFTTPSSHNTANVRFSKALTLCRCTVDSKSVGGDVFSVTPSNKCDVDYLGESTKGDLNVKLEHLEAFGKFRNFSKFPLFFFCCCLPFFGAKVHVHSTFKV